MLNTFLSAFAGLASATLLGCAEMHNSPTSAQPASADEAQQPVEPGVQTGPMEYEALLTKLGVDRSKLPQVEMTVEGKGKVTLEFATSLAPETSKHILKLIAEGYYDKQRIHRVEPWVVQWGAPASKDKPLDAPEVSGGGSGKQLPFESNDIKMGRGVLAMASTGSKVGGDSQMFILTKVSQSQSDFLQGSYAAFGFVVKGMDIVEKLQKGDRILSMKRVERP